MNANIDAKIIENKKILLSLKVKESTFKKIPAKGATKPGDFLFGRKFYKSLKNKLFLVHRIEEEKDEKSPLHL